MLHDYGVFNNFVDRMLTDMELKPPVLQLSREHLLAAEQALKAGNTDQAISELNVLRQLRLLHQQGMMMMKLPMTGSHSF